MSEQITISFPSASPINTDSFNKQQEDIFNHLMTGKRINRYEAGKLYKIGTLHSRVAEVAKVLRDIGVEIERKNIKALDYFGEEKDVREYWLTEESIKKLESFRNQRRMAA